MARRTAAAQPPPEPIPQEAEPVRAHTTTGLGLAPTAVPQGELQEYELTGPAGPYTVLLNAHDAELRGAKAIRPANKAAGPANK